MVDTNLVHGVSISASHWPRHFCFSHSMNPPPPCLFIAGFDQRKWRSISTRFVCRKNNVSKIEYFWVQLGLFLVYFTNSCGRVRIWCRRGGNYWQVIAQKNLTSVLPLWGFARDFTAGTWKCAITHCWLGCRGVGCGIIRVPCGIWMWIFWWFQTIKMTVDMMDMDFLLGQRM